MTRDTPPGHRRYRFGSWGPDGALEPWHGEPGDVVIEHGPRIGQRLWLVVDVEPLRKWATVLLRPAHLDEILVAVDEGAGQWWMRPQRIQPVDDLRRLLL